MNCKLITLGFLRMMLPPSKPLAPHSVTAASLDRARQEANWRSYDSPAWRRFVSDRRRKAHRDLPAAHLDALPVLIRRQAE